MVEVVPGDMAGGYLMENLCNDIKAGLAYGDIAVLCPQKRQTQQFFNCLTRHKIPAYWLVKDAASKKDYDAAQDRVLISTVHSAKGRGGDLPPGLPERARERQHDLRGHDPRQKAAHLKI